MWSSWSGFGRPIASHCARGDIDAEQARVAAELSVKRPQVGFSSAIRTMSLRMFSGRRGRPTCDFHFQNSLKPLRCQPMWKKRDMGRKDGTETAALRVLRDREAQKISANISVR